MGLFVNFSCRNYWTLKRCCLLRLILSIFVAGFFLFIVNYNKAHGVSEYGKQPGDRIRDVDAFYRMILGNLEYR